MPGRVFSIFTATTGPIGSSPPVSGWPTRTGLGAGLAAGLGDGLGAALELADGDAEMLLDRLGDVAAEDVDDTALGSG